MRNGRGFLGLRGAGVRLSCWLAGTVAVVAISCAPIPPTPTPLPAPQPPSAGKAVVVRRGPTPTAVPGGRPLPNVKVRMRREYWLLEAPRGDARRLEIGLVGMGRPWDAVEETDTWVRIDAGPFTGWAPRDAVELEG